MPEQIPFPWRLAASACIVATVGLSGFAYYLGKSRSEQAETAPAATRIEKPAPEDGARTYRAPIAGTRLIRTMRVTPAGPGAIRLGVSIDFVASNRQQVPGILGEFEITVLLFENQGTYSDPDRICQLRIRFEDAKAELDQKGLCGEPENPVVESLGTGNYPLLTTAEAESDSATVIAKCPAGLDPLICSSPLLVTANEVVDEVRRHAAKAAATGGAVSIAAFDDVDKTWRQDLRKGCIERDWPEEQKQQCLSESFDARLEALRAYTGVVELGLRTTVVEASGGRLRNAVDSYAADYRAAVIELPMYYPKLRTMLGASAADEFHELLEIRSESSSNLFQAGCAAEGCAAGEAAFDLDPELAGVTAAIVRGGKARVWSTHAASMYELPGAIRVWLAERTTSDVEVSHHSFEQASSGAAR